MFIEDVDAHFQKAKAAGAHIVEDLHETEYGERQYGAEDFAGHHWLFSRHARDMRPDQWGATVSQPAEKISVAPMLWFETEPAQLNSTKQPLGLESYFAWTAKTEP